jgi:DNA-directed RNA polymerase specialized sigma24 family protein
LCPDELADETLNRVARRLEEEGGITSASPARYCYIVARFVFLEYLRTPLNRQVSLEATGQHADTLAPVQEDQSENRAKRLVCLDGCLEKLKSEDRDVILEYYRGEQGVRIERRRKLAATLGLTINALSIRACRIRDRLEECVRACCAGQ